MSFKKCITLVATASACAAFLGAAHAETIPEKLMEDIQIDFGFTDFQAAGIVGNLARETGNFRYMEEINPTVKGSKGGIGYSQWTGPRRKDFVKWASENGHDDILSYEANYGFLYEELTGDYKKTVERVLETKTVEEAARVFMKFFLAPNPKYAHLDERIAYANAYMAGDFTGAGCQQVHEVYTQDDMIIVKMCPDNIVSADADMAIPGYDSETSAALTDVVRTSSLETDIQNVLIDLMRYGPVPDVATVKGESMSAKVDDPFSGPRIVPAKKISAEADIGSGTPGL